MRLTFKSSLTNLCEVNSSFDTGVLRVAYANDNRNGSYISQMKVLWSPLPPKGETVHLLFQERCVLSIKTYENQLRFTQKQLQ